MDAHRCRHRPEPTTRPPDSTARPDRCILPCKLPLSLRNARLHQARDHPQLGQHAADGARCAVVSALQCHRRRTGHPQRPPRNGHKLWPARMAPLEVSARPKHLRHLGHRSHHRQRRRLERKHRRRARLLGQHHAQGRRPRRLHRRRHQQRRLAANRPRRRPDEHLRRRRESPRVEAALRSRPAPLPDSRKETPKWNRQ